MTTPPPGATEHRLALVMNGGVSLAIWMGGATQTIDTLRRASSGLPPPSPGWPGDEETAAERTLFRRWGEESAKAGKRFTVDVIAGTSAGGLNGVLLAAAIGKGVPLGGLHDLWMDAPALTADRLLRPQDGEPTSILNGDYFQEQILIAIGRLSRASAAATAGDTRDDRGRDVDVSLTVTATGLGGRARIVQDRNGTKFFEQDHRRRYGFRRVSHRYDYHGTLPPTGGALNEFTDDDVLGLVARATASFPAAFAPVRETDDLRQRRTWPTWDTGDAHEYLADGGVLDNSPFECVLDDIAAQPVDTPWRRTVCFIVPSADEVGHEPPPAPTSPPPWTSVVGAALGDPREANLRDDIEQMHDLMRSSRATYDVRRLRLLLATPPAEPAEEPTENPPKKLTPFETAELLATRGFPLYVETRRAATLYDAQDVASDALPTAFLSPIVDFKSPDVQGARQWVPDEFPTAVGGPWTWGVGAASRIVALLVRSLADRFSVADSVRTELSDTGLQLAAVAAAVDASIAGAVGARATTESATWSPSPGDVAHLLDEAYEALNVPATVGALVAGAVGLYSAEVPNPDGTTNDALRVLKAAVCVEIVNGASGDPLDLRSRPKFDFLRLGLGTPPPMFSALFDGPPGGPVPARSDILYGSRLSHFAAFGETDWRQWDWMWGRIHATVQLVSLLGLGEDAEAALVDELVELVLTAEGTDAKTVLARIPHVLGLDPRDLLSAMAKESELRPTIDAVLDLLASSPDTEPRVWKPLTIVGKAVKGSGLGAVIATAVEAWYRIRR